MFDFFGKPETYFPAKEIKTNDFSTFVAFDIETTGLNRDSYIIELGAVKVVNGKVTEVFDEFVKPDISIPPQVTAITGITDKDVANAKDITHILKEFQSFSKGFVLLGHNAINFDCKVVEYWANKCEIMIENDVFDTLRFVRTNKDKYPGMTKKNLSALCDYFGIVSDTFHRAAADAYATAQVYFSL